MKEAIFLNETKSAHLFFILTIKQVLNVSTSTLFATSNKQETSNETWWNHHVDKQKCWKNKTFNSNECKFRA